MYPMLTSVLDMCVHDLISCGMFHAVRVELCWCELFCNVRCVQQWWKVWPKVIYIEHWVQTKEWWDGELKGIVTNSVGDGVQPILEWVKFVVGYNKAILMQL